MGASFVPITVFTVLWGVVGIVCPFFAPKGPNRGIIQVVLMLTAATCWLFWLCAYMAQMNPLIGPRLNNETLIWIARTWTLFVWSTLDAIIFTCGSIFERALWHWVKPYLCGPYDKWVTPTTRLFLPKTDIVPEVKLSLL